MHVSYQWLELVWWLLILITFSGQMYTDMIWNIPYSFVLDDCIEPGIGTHIWGLYLLHGKFSDVFECPRSMHLEAHSMGAHINVDGVFLYHHLVDGRTVLLLATLHSRNYSAGPKLERMRDCGSFLFLTSEYIELIDFIYS